MANVASPRGLRWANKLLGTHWYAVSSSVATAFYVGDPVIMTGTSNNVTIATAGSTNYMVGAIVGVYDTNKVPGIQASTGERLNYKPASTAAYVVVADDPNQVFIAQLATSGSYTADDCGAGCSMYAGSGGSTYSGQSGWVLGAASAATTTLLEQIRLIRAVDRVDNDGTLASADWYVRINLHQRNAAAVGNPV